MAIIFLFATIITASDNTQPCAVVTFLTGRVELCRVQDSVNTSIDILEDLYEGDTVITGEESEVTVLFKTGKILTAGSKARIAIQPTGTDTTRGVGQPEISLNSDINASWTPLFTVGDAAEKVASIMVVRAPDDSLDVTIYSPGNTSLFNKRPDVVWSKQNEANWYRIIFQRMGKVLISIATTDTVCPYTEQNEDLEPGSYMLKVLAYQNSDEICRAERFIKIFAEEDSVLINAGLKSITSLKPDTFTKNLLKALYYEKYSLRQEAIQCYEFLIKHAPEAAFLYKKLAYLYYELGIPQIGNTYLDQYEKLTTQ